MQSMLFHSECDILSATDGGAAKYRIVVYLFILKSNFIRPMKTKRCISWRLRLQPRHPLESRPC